MPEERLAKLLIDQDRFALIIHQYPDGDTIASSFALAIALERMHKHVDLICRDPIPPAFHFLKMADRVQNDFILGDYDLVIVIDSGDLQRTGYKQRILNFAQKKRVVNIDHHPKNDLHQVASLNVVDYNASAVVEIIDRIIDRLPIILDKDIATCLLTGLYTDTGGLKHSNTSVASFHYAGKWLSRGARLRAIEQCLHAQKTIVGLQLVGLALSRLKYHCDLKISASVIRFADLEQLNATAADVNGVISYMHSLDEALASILFIESTKGVIRASIRGNLSDRKINALAEIFGGHGHRKASGFSINGSIVVRGKDWDIIVDE